ncbi:M1 family aminopeptidase [Streptosporangium sp. NPDC001559]|uniref:M1 family aminopeptidase n=1 Tax=Streptosporangium sp. NPDC001559 TaxID=3366187 RepID=UPI0036ED9EFE
MTEREARERSGLLSVLRYDVTVDLRDLDAPRSTTKVVFDGKRAGATFAEARDAGRDLRVPVAVAVGTQAREYTRSLTYDIGGSGLCRVVDEADGSVYVYAASGPTAAPHWFTCFDQPDLKAETSVRVESPPGWVVAGTGMGEAAAAVVPTYATGFVAGPFATETVREDGLGVVLHAVRSRAPVLEGVAPGLARVVAEVVAEIGERLGCPAPRKGGELRIAFVPGLAWPAMETAGCVMVRDSLLVAPGSSGYARLVSVLAHEIAHLWFGNLVTIGWWDDLWLQEALADVVGRTALRATPAGRPYAGAEARRVHSPVTLDRHRPALTAADALASAASHHYSAGVRQVQDWMRALGEKEWWARLARVVSEGPLLDAGALAPPERRSTAGADRWEELQRAVAACEIDGPTALGVLLSLLGHERDADRLAGMTTWFAERLRRAGWTRPAGGREAERLVAEALREVVARAPDGSRLAATATYAWVSTAAAPPVRSLLGGLDGGRSAGPLAWAARNRLAALGELGRRGIVAAGDETGAEVATCLAFLPDAGEKERAWERLFAPGLSDPATLAGMAAGLWHADHPEHVTGLVARFRHETAARTDPCSEPRAVALARFAFPRSVLTADAFTSVGELLGEGRLRPASRAAVRECAAELAWGVRFRSQWMNLDAV